MKRPRIWTRKPTGIGLRSAMDRTNFKPVWCLFYAARPYPSYAFPGRNEVEHVKQLTKADIVAFFTTYFHPDSKTRAKLAVYLMAQGASNDARPIDDSHADPITDIEGFRKSMPTLPDHSLSYE